MEVGNQGTHLQPAQLGSTEALVWWQGGTCTPPTLPSQYLTLKQIQTLARIEAQQKTTTQVIAGFRECGETDHNPSAAEWGKCGALGPAGGDTSPPPPHIWHTTSLNCSWIPRISPVPQAGGRIPPCGQQPGRVNVPPQSPNLVPLFHFFW